MASPNNKTARRKAAAATTLKMRRVQIPYGNYVVTWKDGENLTDEAMKLLQPLLEPVINDRVKMELELRDERAKCAVAQPLPPAELAQKITGMIYSLPSDQQTAVVATVLRNMRTWRTSDEHQAAMRLEQQRDSHQLAQRRLYDLENVMNGNVFVIS